MKKIKNYINGSKFFDLVTNIILIIYLLIVSYPLIYVVSASFSDPTAVTRGELVLLPIGFNLDGYKNVLQYSDIWLGYGNTIFYTVVGTVINLIITLPCAYALSQKHVVGKNVIMIFFMITMYVSGGLIPSYLNVKALGLVNTRIYMLIHGGLSVYNMIVARTFFASSIPGEIIESAKIDGCNDFKAFSKIVMPLSKAIITVEMLYYGIARWNEYFNAMIYLDDREKFPLQLFLRDVLLKNKLAEEALNSGTLSIAEMEFYEELARSADMVKYCIIIVSTLPMLIIYPRIQKYFEKGVMIGSVKG